MTALLALLLAAQAHSQAAAPPDIYRCETALYDLPGLLELHKSFAQDGTPLELDVAFSADGIAIPQAPGDSTIASLGWTNVWLAGPTRPVFDWSRGRITVSFTSQGPDETLRPGEEARRILVERDEALRDQIQSGANGRLVFVSPAEQHLVSERLSGEIPPQLRMSIDSLLAWGSGREQVTVYETAIVTSRPAGQSEPTAMGRERITGIYKIDVPALARLVGQIRAATQAWEAGLTDPRRQCTRS
jgi:hypothetical protein